MKNLFKLQFGFQETATNMKTLFDDGTQQNPTKANILAAIKWLMSRAAPGVQLWVHVSSHGSQIRDKYSSSPNGKVRVWDRSQREGSGVEGVAQSTEHGRQVRV